MRWLLLVALLACAGKPDGDTAGSPDADGDGYTCDDCDDAVAWAHPGADEVWYDGADEDCLGGDDDDQDGDGYAASAEGGPDCDDTDPEVNPAAEEICDGNDNDCDGEIDEGVEVTFYEDGDADEYGSDPIYACEPDTNWALAGGDCDDDDRDVHPGAEETCNGVDDDCDGEVDEECDTR